MRKINYFDIITSNLIFIIFSATIIISINDISSLICGLLFISIFASYIVYTIVAFIEKTVITHNLTTTYTQQHVLFSYKDNEYVIKKRKGFNCILVDIKTYNIFNRQIKHVIIPEYRKVEK